MENQLVEKLGMSNCFSLFGKNGMEQLERVKIHKGCKIISYGGAGYIGYEGVDYVVYDDNMHSVRVYYGENPDVVEDWETEMYFSPYHNLDDKIQHISKKFGIGFYYTDERIDDDVIAKSLRHADKIDERAKQIKDEKANAKKLLREKLIKEYSYLERIKEGDYKSYNKTVGNNIRTELKKHFPTIKFSVRHKSFSGGGDFTISWEDGPMQDVVSNVVKKFQDSHSDCTGDYWDYDPSVFNNLFGGESYIIVSRRQSDNYAEKVLAKYDGLTADNWKNYNGYPEDFPRAWMFEDWRNPTFEGCLNSLFCYTDLTPSETETECKPKDGNVSIGGCEIIDYSEKAICVVGDTYAKREALRKVGGIYRRNWSCGAGWMFSKKKRAEVESALA